MCFTGLGRVTHGPAREGKWGEAEEGVQQKKGGRFIIEKLPEAGQRGLALPGKATAKERVRPVEVSH